MGKSGCFNNSRCVVHLSREQYADTSVAICSPICAQRMKAREFMRVLLSLGLSFCSELSVHIRILYRMLAQSCLVTFYWKCLYINKMILVQVIQTFVAQWEKIQKEQETLNVMPNLLQYSQKTTVDRRGHVRLIFVVATTY